MQALRRSPTGGVQKACAQSPRKATAAAAKTGDRAAAKTGSKVTAKTGNRAAAKTGKGTVSMPAVGQAFRSRRAPVAALKSKLDVQSGESMRMNVDCTANKCTMLTLQGSAARHMLL